jgi:hypothetical protein
MNIWHDMAPELSVALFLLLTGGAVLFTFFMTR